MLFAFNHVSFVFYRFRCLKSTLCLHEQLLGCLSYEFIQSVSCLVCYLHNVRWDWPVRRLCLIDGCSENHCFIKERIRIGNKTEPCWSPPLLSPDLIENAAAERSTRPNISDENCMTWNCCLVVRYFPSLLHIFLVSEMFLMSQRKTASYHHPKRNFMSKYFWEWKKKNVIGHVKFQMWHLLKFALLDMNYYIINRIFVSFF